LTITPDPSRCGSATSSSSCESPIREWRSSAASGERDSRRRISAPFRLLDQEIHVLCDLRPRLQRARHLLGDHLDGGERRAQFVRRRRRQATERRQALLARQHSLRGRQRHLHPLGFGLGLPRIDPRVDDADHRRDGVGEVVERRQMQRRRLPRQRHRPQAHHDHEKQRQRADVGRMTGVKRRRGQDHRRHEQDREGVVETARQHQQHRELDEVDADLKDGFAAGRQPPSGQTQEDEEIHRCGGRQYREAGEDRQVETQDQPDPEHGGRLARDRHPAQQHEQPEPKATARKRPAPQLTRIGRHAVGVAQTGLPARPAAPIGVAGFRSRSAPSPPDRWNRKR
jgi:hypothetical protein